MRLISGIMLLLCSCAIGGELDFTMRDSSGKVVTWSISKPDCDVRDGASLVINKFGLSSLKLLPMCGERVTFFEDRGVFDGVRYTLSGAEYVGPWGTRCAYAVAEAADGTKCPRDVEVALHCLGAFRYCLWGGDWGARKTYEQEIATGEVIDGPATLEAQKRLIASGVDEARAWQPVYKKASLWMEGSIVKQIPLPTDKFALSLVSNSEGVFYARTELTTRTVMVEVPTFVQTTKRRFGRLSDDSSCSTVVVDPNTVPTTIDGMAVTRVVLRTTERTCTAGENQLGEQPMVRIMVKQPIVQQYAKITTYPCY